MHGTNDINAWTKTKEKGCDNDIGRLVVLPSTHIGSERYMRQKMQDIIAISNSIGHLDIFLTMTCNPRWPEMVNALLPGQKSRDRPDLSDRMLRMKLKLLLNYIKEEKPFGEVISEKSVIEFQKRGLVHAHVILFLHHSAKFDLENPSNFDNIISAEIPPKTVESLRSAVLAYMIHRPCDRNAHYPCMKDGKCSKYFPK